MKNMFGNEINEDRLREMYLKDPLVRALMDVLANEPTDHRQLTVDELCDLLGKAETNVHRHDVIRMLQSLHGENRGSFTVGRHGYASRFDFYASSRSLADAAIGKDAAKLRPLLKHKFRLRPDLEITLELPSDLTAKEVGRIADFLKTLPFDTAGLGKAA